MKHFLVFAMALVATCSTFADDWPQWFGSKRDGICEEGILDKFPKDGPKQLWKHALGQGTQARRSQAIVFMSWIASPRRFKAIRRERRLCGQGACALLECRDRQRDLDPRIRLHLSANQLRLWSANHADYRRRSRLHARHDGRFALLGSKTGKPIWAVDFAKDLKAKVPVWGWSSNPLVDGNKIICLVGGEKQPLSRSIEAMARSFGMH